LTLKYGKIDKAIECLEKSDDLGGLLLIFTSLGMKKKLGNLALRAQKLTRTNIAFQCFFLLVSFLFLYALHLWSSSMILIPVSMSLSAQIASRKQPFLPKATAHQNYQASLKNGRIP